MAIYASDLAYVHDAAFGDYARRTAPEIVRVLRRKKIRSGLTVELGCGSGITAQCLVEHGFAVHGIDVSPAMIRLARARVRRATFRVGSVWTARLPSCVAVVSVGEVLTYASTPGFGVHRVRSLFRRVHDALRPGGVFVFDFIESVDGRTYARRSHAGRDWALTVSASVDPTGRWLTRRITVFGHRDGTFRRTQEVHRVRIFDREELGPILRTVGFNVRFQQSLGPVKMMKGDVVAVATRV